MRWILRLLGVGVSLAVLAGLVLFLLPSERIAGLAAQRFEVVTGRTLSITGPVRATLYPMVGARLESVSLANAPWSDQGPMMRAESIDVGLDLRALLGGDIIIRKLELRAPQIVLERARDGRTNWTFDTTAAAPDTAGRDARAFALDLAEVSDGSFRYVDHGAGRTVAVSGLEGSLRMPGPDTEVRLSARGRLAGEAFTLEATAERARSLFEGGVTPVSVTAGAVGATLDFRGRAGLAAFVAEGRTALSVPRLAPLQRMFGQSPTELAPGLEPLSFTGQLTRTAEGSLHARDAVFGFGPNRVRGAADLRPGAERPRLTAQLSGDALDLRALTGEAAATPAQPGWSRAALPLASLGALDADVALVARAIQVGALPLGESRVTMRLDAARAVFDVQELQLFDGTIRGEFVLNGRGNGSVGGNLRAENVALLPLLSTTAEFSRLEGTGNARLQFLGVGNSLHAIMHSLSGTGRIELGSGAIVGLDLAGMLRNLDMSYMGEGTRTIYDRITGSFTIAEGVLRNDDLRLEATRLSVTGRGTVGLGERVLNYRVTPEAMRDPETGAALRVPVLITGPWDAPRFRLDLEGLAQQRLEAERERLEALARDEARRQEQELRRRAEQELQDRLGVERQEGESLEDAARRALEREIGRGLQRLLGRD